MRDETRGLREMWEHGRGEAVFEQVLRLEELNGSLTDRSSAVTKPTQEQRYCPRAPAGHSALTQLSLCASPPSKTDDSRRLVPSEMGFTLINAVPTVDIVLNINVLRGR